MTRRNDQLLAADARNRALRTFLQGLAIDIATGVALVLTTVLATANGWGDLEWAVLSFSIAKSIVQSIASYVMRRFLDGSAVPTPLPPAPSAEPDNDTGATALEVAVIVLIVLVVLLVLGFIPR